MKIMAIADVESKALWDFFSPEKVKDVDLIISCGDLKQDYIEFLETMTNCPLLYIRGNHDGDYARRPPQGCICIEDKVYDYKGLRILGLGGSMRYHDGPNMFTEAEMRQRIRRVNPSIKLHNGFDLLVTHSPAKGYGDRSDLPHTGFECFNELMEKWHPKYMLFGHIHKEYGGFQREYEHPSGAKLINAYNYITFDIGDDEHPAKGKTGSALYDLYISLQRRGHSE